MRHYLWTADRLTNMIVGSILEFGSASKALEVREGMIAGLLNEDPDDLPIVSGTSIAICYSAAADLQQLKAERPGQFHDDTRVILSTD